MGFSEDGLEHSVRLWGFGLRSRLLPWVKDSTQTSGQRKKAQFFRRIYVYNSYAAVTVAVAVHLCFWIWRLCPVQTHNSYKKKKHNPGYIYILKHSFCLKKKKREEWVCIFVMNIFFAVWYLLQKKRTQTFDIYKKNSIVSTDLQRISTFVMVLYKQ